MIRQSLLLRGTLPVLAALTFCVVVEAQTKRYAVLGEDLGAAEAALAKLGAKKIKRFRNLRGLAVNLSDSQADNLKVNLGRGLRLINDPRFNAFDDADVAKGKPGGGGGKPGGETGQQVSWGTNAVNAGSAWADPSYGTRGAGVAICVVDSGLDVDHPDLAANIAGGANYINGGSWDDDNGHGTHVGGIIAAVNNSIGVVGVAPEATLLGAKAFDRRGTGTNADVADAILGCPGLRDQHASGMPLVVNMSFRLTNFDGGAELVHDAIITVKEETDAVFVAAAGNLGESFANLITIPARWDEVMAITGSQEDLSFWPRSGHGGFNDPVFSPDPAFIAPATNILSLWKKGGTKTLDGTSMASAFAAGVVALGLSVDSLAPLGLDLGLPSNQQGAGLIDALLTVQNHASAGGVASVPEPTSAVLLIAVLVFIPLLRKSLNNQGKAQFHTSRRELNDE